MRTDRGCNLDLYHGMPVAGSFDMPALDACDAKPVDLMGFNYVMSDHGARSGIGIHFFIDDYQFERVWRDPDFYGERMSGYGCVIAPDFSLYSDMPMAMQVWNVYRSHLVARIWQDMGLRVVPLLQWSDRGSHAFCFDGIPHASTVAVSTVGVVRDAEARRSWAEGMDAAIAAVTPDRVLLYGVEPDGYEWPMGLEVVRYGTRKWRR
jgi:hypothetical protein